MKSALLVIDVQCGLFTPTLQPFEASTVLERINQLSSWARTCGYPVIFIQHEDEQLVFAESDWALDKKLVTQDSDHFVRKTTPDSFHHTQLADLLQKQDIEHVYITGYASEFCVDTTVRRAAALGYAVTLVGDAHTTHDKPHASGAMIREHHNQTLSNISSFGVPICALSSQTILNNEP